MPIVNKLSLVFCYSANKILITLDKKIQQRFHRIYSLNKMLFEEIILFLAALEKTSTTKQYMFMENGCMEARYDPSNKT
jgi:hypothetical protein